MEYYYYYYYYLERYYILYYTGCSIPFQVTFYYLNVVKSI